MCRVFEIPVRTMGPSLKIQIEPPCTSKRQIIVTFGLDFLDSKYSFRWSTASSIQKTGKIERAQNGFQYRSSGNGPLLRFLEVFQVRASSDHPRVLSSSLIVCFGGFELT